MKKRTLFISFCAQKGGVGKSAFTVLAASYLHYQKGYNVAIVDCDFPQHSVHLMRERDLDLVSKSEYYKRMAYRQFEQEKKRVYPILKSSPENAIEVVNNFIETDEREFDVVFFDLPGTINSTGVLSCISILDYVFIPIIADRLVMESNLNFALMLQEQFVTRTEILLKASYLFWNKVDMREKTELYEGYDKAIKTLELPLLKTRIPDTKKYNKEISEERTNVFRSTLFTPDRRQLKESHLEELMNEICKRIKL